jgi:hypothetical protein
MVVFQILGELVRVAGVELSVGREIMLGVKREGARFVGMRQCQQVEPVIARQSALLRRRCGVAIDGAVPAEDALGQKAG